MIYEHFRATGACEAPQGPSDLFKNCLHDDDIQDFDTRWDRALLAASNIPMEKVLEDLCRWKNTRFCSASNSISNVRPRNWSKAGIAKLSKIEDHGKTTYWSDE